MKVLESGSGQKGWAAKHECTGSGNGGGGCRAKLLVEAGDIFRTESHARDETSFFYTFECPECHVRTDVMESTLPSSVKEAAPYRSPPNRAPSEAR